MSQEAEIALKRRWWSFDASKTARWDITIEPLVSSPDIRTVPLVAASDPRTSDVLGM
jgi:hypothetical protein